MMNRSSRRPHAGILSMHIRRTFNRTVFLFFSFFVYSTTACADKTGNPYRLEVMDAASAHASAGYTIQVGAYSSKANAYRVIDRLQSHGIDAYCFSCRYLCGKGTFYTCAGKREKNPNRFPFQQLLQDKIRGGQDVLLIA